jgi:ankyrin repeat protein
MKLQTLLEEYQELPEFEGVPLKSVNQQGAFKSTPLHIAIYRERSDEVRVLLEANADPNAPGEYGERPLHVAVNCGNLEIIEQLLRAGARCDLKDEKEMDAWLIAKSVGFTEKLEEVVRGIAPAS